MNNCVSIGNDYQTVSKQVDVMLELLLITLRSMGL